MYPCGAEKAAEWRARSPCDGLRGPCGALLDTGEALAACCRGARHRPHSGRNVKGWPPCGQINGKGRGGDARAPNGRPLNRPRLIQGAGNAEIGKQSNFLDVAFLSKRMFMHAKSKKMRRVLTPSRPTSKVANEGTDTGREPALYSACSNFSRVGMPSPYSLFSFLTENIIKCNVPA